MIKTASILTETHFCFCAARLWDDLKMVTSIQLQYQIYIFQFEKSNPNPKHKIRDSRASEDRRWGDQAKIMIGQARGSSGHHRGSGQAATGRRIGKKISRRSIACRCRFQLIIFASFA
jgi:hypothetical protein